MNSNTHTVPKPYLMRLSGIYVHCGYSCQYYFNLPVLSACWLHMLRSLWCAAQMGHFGGPQGPYLRVHFFRNVLRIGFYILSSSLQLGSKQRISSDFGNQRYLIGVIDIGCICGVMWLPPGDYCNGWLGMGDDKIFGGGSIQMGLHGDKFSRYGACLVLSSL